MSTTNKCFFFILSFFVFTGTIQSQNKVIDSLRNKVVNHKKNDTTKVMLLYDIAFESFRSDIKNATLYANKAEKLANDLNYVKGKAKVFYLKGILENIKSDYDKSLFYFKKSLVNYEIINDKSGIASIYTSFGITYFDQSQYIDAIKTYQKASDIYKEIGNQSGLITCLINIGNAYSETGRYDDAISNYKKALETSKLIKDEDGFSYVHSNLGIVYKKQGNYPLAIDNFNKSLYYDEKTVDSLGISMMLNSIGEVYSYLKESKKALAYHQKSLKYALKSNYKSLVAINNVNIGNIYRAQNNNQKALVNYKNSLEISKQINDLKNVSICYANIGAVNLSLNNVLLARENFLKAKDISEQSQNTEIVIISLLGISETYIYENNYPKALFFAKKGEALAKELNILESQKKASKLLSEIYENTSQYKKAFESHQQFKILNDSLLNKENIQRITQLEYEYKYEKELDKAEEREIKLTNTVKDTSENLIKSQRNLLLGIVAFLVISFLLGTVIFFLKLRNEKEKTQNIVIEQKLLRSQMTPHFIFNSLSVLQGMILNKEEKKSVSYLSKFSKLLRITLENSRDKLVSLEQELTAVENYLALQNLENEAYEYSVSTEEIIDSTKFQVPPMLIQPFVENAIEHAFVNQTGNKKIDVYLKYSNKNLICTIADNGSGINLEKDKTKANKKSLSTTITAERLSMLAKDFKMTGSVTVEDRKQFNEQGTIITLVIPHKINVV